MTDRLIRITTALAVSAWSSRSGFPSRECSPITRASLYVRRCNVVICARSVVWFAGPDRFGGCALPILGAVFVLVTVIYRTPVHGAAPADVELSKVAGRPQTDGGGQHGTQGLFGRSLSP